MRRLLWFTCFGCLLLSARAQIPGGAVFAGTVYNVFHEEWDTDEAFFHQVDADMAAIAAAGFTHVLIFPMNQWDPATKELLWTRTDYLVGAIERQHLKFVPILLKEEQCSHYFPIWKFREIPGLWSEHARRNGSPNNRENVDFADPRIFPLLKDYLGKVVSRYRHSPALAFYNLWNEPHYQAESEHVVARFRVWLKNKYGDLPALRRAWGEDYTDWEEVTPFLNDDWNSSLPAIDWRLFRNELCGTLLGELASVVKQVDPLHPVNANPVGSPLCSFGDFGGYGTDVWQFTPHQDFNGASYYPDAAEISQRRTETPLWLHHFAFNTFRSAAAGKDYILTECYTNAKNGLALAGYLDEAALNRLAWTALSDDCKGILFWKWEPFHRGRQALGRGLTYLDGTLAPRGKAASNFAKVLSRYGKSLHDAHLEPPQIGILLDQVGLLKTRDQPGDPRTRAVMQESVAGVFSALEQGGFTADLVRTDLPLAAEQLSRYRVLIMPCQIVVRAPLARTLATWVEQGGVLIADARTGVLSEDDRALLRNPGYGLDELFGARCQDWVGSPEGPLVTPVAGEPFPSFQGRFFREKLLLYPGTDTLGTFADGEPAVTRRRHGKGKAVLFGTLVGAAVFETRNSPAGAWLRTLCEEAGVKPPVQAEGPEEHVTELSLRLHHGAGGDVVYAINGGNRFLRTTLRVEASTPGHGPSKALELLTEQPVEVRTQGTTRLIPLSLSPGGVAVFLLSEP